MDFLGALFLVLLFIAIYHAARKVYLFVLQLAIERHFDADVTFATSYSFGSIQDVLVKGKKIELRCKLINPSWGLHTRVVVKDLEIVNGTIEQMRETTKVLAETSGPIATSLRFFHISLVVDKAALRWDDGRSMEILELSALFTNSLYLVTCKAFTFDSQLVNVSVRDYSHEVHFGKTRPERLNFGRPNCSISTEGSKMVVKFGRSVGFSCGESIWRSVVAPIEVTTMFKGPNVKLSKFNAPVDILGDVAVEFGENGWSLLCDEVSCGTNEDGFSVHARNLRVGADDAEAERFNVFMRERDFDVASLLTEGRSMLSVAHGVVELQMDGGERMLVSLEEFVKDGMAVKALKFETQIIVGCGVVVVGLSGKGVNISNRCINIASAKVVQGASAAMHDLWPVLINFARVRLSVPEPFTIFVTRISMRSTCDYGRSDIKEAVVMIDVKESVPIDDVKNVLMSLVPGIEHMISAENSGQVHFTTTISSVDCDSLFMSRVEMSGMASLITCGRHFVSCGTMNLKVEEMALDTNEWTPKYDNWSINIACARAVLRNRRAAYVLENCRGEWQMFSFDSIWGSLDVEKTVSMEDVDSDRSSFTCDKEWLPEFMNDSLRLLVSHELGFGDSSARKSGLRIDKLRRQRKKSRTVSTHSPARNLRFSLPFETFVDEEAGNTSHEKKKRRTMKYVVKANLLRCGYGDGSVTGRKLTLWLHDATIGEREFFKVTLTFIGSELSHVKANIMKSDAIQGCGVEYSAREKRLNADSITYNPEAGGDMKTLLQGLDKANIKLLKRDASFAIDLESVEIARVEQQTIFVRAVSGRVAVTGFTATLTDVSAEYGDRIRFSANNIVGKMSSDLDFMCFAEFVSLLNVPEIEATQCTITISASGRSPSYKVVGDLLKLFYTEPDDSGHHICMYVKDLNLYDISGGKEMTVFHMLHGQDDPPLLDIGVLKDGAIRSFEIGLVLVTLFLDACHEHRLSILKQMGPSAPLNFPTIVLDSIVLHVNGGLVEELGLLKAIRPQGIKTMQQWIDAVITHYKSVYTAAVDKAKKPLATDEPADQGRKSVWLPWGKK